MQLLPRKESFKNTLIKMDKTQFEFSPLLKKIEEIKLTDENQKVCKKVKCTSYNTKHLDSYLFYRPICKI